VQRRSRKRREKVLCMKDLRLMAKRAREGEKGGRLRVSVRKREGGREREGERKSERDSACVYERECIRAIVCVRVHVCVCVCESAVCMCAWSFVSNC